MSEYSEWDTAFILSDLKTLEEHNAGVLSRKTTTGAGNGIECPECKSELHDVSTGVMLACDPPKYAIVCLNCAYGGSRY